ncbi:MAG: hypothetical protein DME18_11385 [Verrucomicrobia bacterium]|nr:MAG: hypothetical protein DME18_11385 [Verrucomicrobiota bacterium]
MKFLIVNGDDFGASRGINRGILEAHERGILTSTSLLVKTPWSEEAAELSRDAESLSVGLHVDLGKEPGPTTGSQGRLREELRRQFARFQELMHRRPTHLDSHHNVHRDPQALPLFLELAEEHGLPLREHSSARYFSKFYGQWGGQTHLEQLGVESLARMLATEIGDGFTELGCHPGYVDPDYPSGYSTEREAELRTLCHPRIRQALAEQAIQLVSHHDLGKLVVISAT